MPESACVKRGNRPNHKARRMVYRDRAPINRAYRLIRALERTPNCRVTASALDKVPKHIREAAGERLSLARTANLIRDF